MSTVTGTQRPSNGRHARRETPAGSTTRPETGTSTVASVPLSAENSPRPGETSLGGLVREATTHMSSLFRAELELAKAEMTSEVRKGVKGSVFFIAALVVVLYSLFFLFFAVAEALDLALPDWAAFLITFAGMFLVAALLGLLGYLRVRKIRKPERTITTTRESIQTISRRGQR